MATSFPASLNRSVCTTESVCPSFLGVATQVMREPLAGRRNSMLLEAVTHTPPLEQAQQPPTVSAMVARAPQELTNRGCGYCVKVSPRRFLDAIGVLRRAGVPHGRLFREEPGGRYVEVGE